jgi:hypothetical protein
MADSDTFPYLSATANPLPSRRQQPREYSAPTGENGYPNKVANTQTMRTRGTKNTARGNSNSTKMG